MLDRLIRRSGIDKNQFYFGLAQNGWFADAKRLGVKVVVPMGESALRAALQESDIVRWRGRVAEHPEFPWLTLPTFSPKYLLHRKRPAGAPPDPDQWPRRNPPRYVGRVLRDLHYAKEIARKGFVRRPVHYLLDPDPEQFLQWVRTFLELAERNPELALAWDIETPYKKDNAEDEDELEETQKASDRNLTILRHSFSYVETEAVTVPDSGLYREGIKLLLASSAPKVTHNGRDFDVPVAKFNGYAVNGRLFDNFDLIKFWQSDIDKGLEVISADTTDLLPWKHLSDAMPEHYSAVDADAQLRTFNYIAAQIKAQGAWEKFLETFTDLMPHMVDAGNRGNAIDLDYQSQLRVEFEAESERLDQEIQEVVSDQFRARHRYKRMPAGLHRVALDTGGYIWLNDEGNRVEPVRVAGKARFCSNCGLQGVTQGGHTSKKTLGKRLIEEKHHPKKCTFSDLFSAECTCPKGWPKRKYEVTPNPCHGAEVVERAAMVTEWDELLPFNVNSSDQLIDYMKAHKHPVGKNSDDPDKDSADAEHLKMLAKQYGTKHPMYELAGEKKKVDKARSTYLWIPGSDGRIHQTYVNSPNTLRFGGRAYNLMNVGKREENPHAVRARNQIIASPGHVLVQADSTSVEGVMQGWFMGDEHYMWLANQSIHAWLATKHLGWDFNPDTVAKVKKDHKALYDGMKVMNYTTNFGGSPYGAHMANRDLFPSPDSAEEIQSIIFQLIPTLEAYQYEQRFRAHKQGFIESPWKWRGYFYDVFTYKRNRFGQIEYTRTGRPKLKLSKDGKRVVAVLPQHSNAMFGRQNLRMIGESKWGRYMPANVFVHDGYTLDVPVGLADEAEDFLLTLLTRPIPEMGGLRVGAASDIGKNWGDHHPVHNPNGMKGSRKIVIDKQTLSWMPSSAAFPEEMLRAA
jgi:DNA polymerase I-like protein with 3'-5' exonuclease and polymerase domains